MADQPNHKKEASSTDSVALATLHTAKREALVEEAFTKLADLATVDGVLRSTLSSWAQHHPEEALDWRRLCLSRPQTLRQWLADVNWGSDSARSSSALANRPCWVL